MFVVLWPKTHFCVCVCVLGQSVHSQLRIKGEGSAGELQHQEQEHGELSRGAEDKSARSAGA